MTIKRLLNIFICAMTLSSGFTGYVRSIAADREKKQPMPSTPIEATLEAHADALMALPGVVGVGLLGDAPCIKVFVVVKTSALQQQIPKALDEHPIVVEQTGEFRAPLKR